MFITPLKTMDASRTMSPSLFRQHITDMISMHCSKHKGNSAQRFVKFGSSLVTSKHLPCFSAYILVNFSRRRLWVWQECSMQLTTLSDVSEVFHNYFLEEPVVRLDNKTLTTQVVNMLPKLSENVGATVSMSKQYCSDKFHLCMHIYCN